MIRALLPLFVLVVVNTHAQNANDIDINNAVKLNNQISTLIESNGDSQLRNLSDKIVNRSSTLTRWVEKSEMMARTIEERIKTIDRFYREGKVAFAETEILNLKRLQAEHATFKNAIGNIMQVAQQRQSGGLQDQIYRAEKYWSKLSPSSKLLDKLVQRLQFGPSNVTLVEIGNRYILKSTDTKITNFEPVSLQDKLRSQNGEIPPKGSRQNPSSGVATKRGVELSPNTVAHLRGYGVFIPIEGSSDGPSKVYSATGPKLLDPYSQKPPLLFRIPGSPGTEIVGQIPGTSIMGVQ